MTEATWKADPAGEGYDEVRTGIVDAAEKCVNEGGVSSVRLERVAEEAGCTRQNLYRYFDSKDELIRAVIVRKAVQIAETVEARLDGLDDPVEQIVEGMLQAVEALRADPTFGPLITEPDIATISRIAGDSDVLPMTVAPFLHTALDEASRRGWLRNDISAQDAAEWMVMVAISQLTFGAGSRTREEQAAFLRRMLVPSILST